jgi:hypothetical protein
VDRVASQLVQTALWVRVFVTTLNSGAATASGISDTATSTAQPQPMHAATAAPAFEHESGHKNKAKPKRTSLSLADAAAIATKFGALTPKPTLTLGDERALPGSSTTSSATFAAAKARPKNEIDRTSHTHHTHHARAHGHSDCGIGVDSGAAASNSDAAATRIAARRCSNIALDSSLESHWQTLLRDATIAELMKQLQTERKGHVETQQNFDALAAVVRTIPSLSPPRFTKRETHRADPPLEQLAADGHQSHGMICDLQGGDSFAWV